MIHLTKSTKSIRENEIKREWHIMDAKGKVLGRFATEVSKYLMGKHKRNYISHMDGGDTIVVINARLVELTGRKSQFKVYSRYSGYPGGLKQIPFETMKEKKPAEIIRHAVLGMLPKNKLRARRIARLHVFAGDEHPFGDKVKN